MIKGNIIEFGYGDIAVSSNGMGYISFTNIKPPLKCGQIITKVMRKDLEIGLNITIFEDKLWEVYNLVKTISKNNRVVKYKDYILDFSNYNEESVKVVLRGAFNMVNLRCLAC